MSLIAEKIIALENLKVLEQEKKSKNIFNKYIFEGELSSMLSVSLVIFYKLSALNGSKKVFYKGWNLLEIHYSKI